MARYLILERRNETMFAYFEDSSHFEKVMKHEDMGNRLWKNERENAELNVECDLSRALKDGEWMRIKVRKSQGVEE